MTHQTGDLQFDPALKQRLLVRTGDPLAEEGAAETISVVARLVDPAVPVPGLEVVSRLGPVVTARLPLERVVEVRRHPNVASLKDSVTFGADLAVSVPDIGAAPALLARAGLGGLTGRGVAVGVADWGCDFAHANFRRADGRTRLLYLWDQRGGARASSPRPYGYGRELDAAAIDAALAAADPYAALGYDPALGDPGRRGTHGTHVLDIAAGNGRAAGSAPGVAPEADLIFVHLRGNDTAPEDTLGDSARLLEAVDYIIRRAGDRPVSINLSLGRTGGPKDGTTLVEQALDALLAERDGRAVCMSTGNYYDAALHSSGRLATGEATMMRWDVTPRDDEFAEMEIWYAGGDAFGVELLDPHNRRLGAAGPGETAIVRDDNGVILASIFNRRHDPNNGENVINLFLWPDAAVGAWGVRLLGRSVEDGRFHAWIERGHPVTQSRFHHADADPLTTVGTICTGRLTIPVGAYDARAPDRPVVYFSSAGPSRDGRGVPLLSAPGAGIRAARSSSPDSLGYRAMDTTTVKSGSSMAAPHVTGVVALMFQAALPGRLAASRVRDILTATARRNPPHTAADELRYGAGRVDAVAALQAVATPEVVATPQVVAVTEAVAAPAGEAAPDFVPPGPAAANGTATHNHAPAAHAPAPLNGTTHGHSPLPPPAAPAENGGKPVPANPDIPERTLPALPEAAVAEWPPDHAAHDTGASLAEVATDPVTPVRPPIALVDGVGRGRRNRVADVRAVQTALRDLRYLSAADFAAESPAAGATGTVADAALARTIAAVEQLQREVQGRAHPDGRIDRGGATLAALNRAVPRPTAAEFTAVGRALATITETTVSGVALSQPVGNVADAEVAAGRGNLPDEVRAVQTRLVQLGHLAAGHGEAPAAGAAAPRAAQLPRTRAAIVRFQDREVGWWRNRRVGGATPITGGITRGVVAPNDATHRLLRAITGYREQFPDGTDIRLRDFVRSGRTESSAGVMFGGTASPTALPAAVYNTVGLTADQTAAMQFVSRHEGNFDALNTYDVARVSLGFVQFAGGRGLPPFLALLKSRHPATFRTQLAAFGIEVEFNAPGGNVANAAVVVLDPARSVVLRGSDAEAFIRDNKKLSAVLIRAGRDATVQEVQVEAATRDYLLPALATTALLQDGPPPVRARLEQILRSRPGIAVLLDRAIHEGVGGGTARLEGAARWVAEDQGLTTVAAVAARERAVLQQVVDDLTADLDIAARVQTAIRSLEALRAAAVADVAAALARPEAAAARRELDAAIAALPRKSFGPRRARATTELRAERARLNFAAPPATVAALRAELDGVIGRLKTVRENGGRLNVGWADSIRARIRNILAHWPPAAAPAPPAPPAGGAGATEAEQPAGAGGAAPLAHMAFSHILPESLDPATSALVPGVVPATPATLTTPFYNADVAGVTPDPTLQQALTTVLGSKPSYRNAGTNLAVSLVDLSGANKFAPKYAGFNDLTNFYGASVNKIVGLLGVYQLLAEANELLRAKPSISDAAGLAREMALVWTQAGIAARHHPMVANILVVQPGSPPTAVIHPELLARLSRISHGNRNGATPIVLLKFPFIGSTLLAHGLYSPVNRGGLWVRKSYGRDPIEYRGQHLSIPAWPAAENPHPRTHVHNINAVSVAQFYTLAAQRRMIDTATSRAVLGHLQTGGCITTSEIAPLFAGGQLAAKCGLWKEWVHNTLHFKETATLREFVVVMLTRNNTFEVMKDLVKDLVALVP